ncbi:hypothetical protein Metvu_0807 [Methanocaldococcus vulcanius M7]|uniref:Uncharacterized protein n=1 Tax=Methanocaldococcus vulcanius (strain ATCC 700851 / DSM 12094 / M7) TaxID=579137 RepID=C9RGG3_METVM|nr:hypothetical protein Metvu_0807 [Methanocaldococcus vulcanius M7]
MKVKNFYKNLKIKIMKSKNKNINKEIKIKKLNRGII